MRISVAMCTYNGASFLREQLDSISSQARPPDELVICDDCSIDETAEIIEAFAARASFPVHLHVNERNLGSTKNFERAIRLCDGDIIALSDQDDVWHAQKLLRLEHEFARSPHVGLVFTDAEVSDENLRSLGSTLWQRVDFNARERQLFRAGKGLLVLLDHNVVTGATMAFRAAFKNLILPIPLGRGVIHDGWIAMLIAAFADVSFIDEPLIKYRQHANQQVGAVETAGLAPENVPVGELWSAAKQTRPADYLAELNWLIPLRERLSAREGQIKCSEAFQVLRDRTTHLQTRAALPASRLRRAPVVARELLKHRYHLYSRGFYSAAKDLLS